MTSFMLPLKSAVIKNSVYTKVYSDFFFSIHLFTQQVFLNIFYIPDFILETWDMVLNKVVKPVRGGVGRLTGRQ